MPHHIVFAKIGVVLALFGGGWLLRRRGLVEGTAVASLSRIVVDVAFPALVLVQIPRTVDAATLQLAWPLPVAGFTLIGGGMVIGRLLARSPTGAFLIGLPNWIFLPLLIAQGLYGAEGVRAVLLFNAGAQPALWTAGVVTLGGRANLLSLLRNPGLVATAIGLVVALGLPDLAAYARGGGASGWVGLAGRSVVEALDLVGTVTIPLSLLVTGAQLAEQTGGGDAGELLRVLAGRMVLVPLATWGLLQAAASIGAPLPHQTRVVLLIIAAMPVALSGSLFAQRFGGDTPLAARAVLVSTLLSLASVPALVAWVA